MLRRYSPFLCSTTRTTTTAAAVTAMQKAGGPTLPSNEQVFQVRRSVIPLQERFGGAGLGKPETPSQIRAHPLDFNVIRGGTTLKITWRIVNIIPQAANDEEGQQQQQHQEAEDKEANKQEKEQQQQQRSVEQVTTTVTAELMRVCAPSTDVLSLPQNVAVSGKRGLTLTDLTLVGNYALRVSFSDGHTAGIFGYQYLFDLSGPEKWLRSRMYLETLRGCRRSRDPVKKKDGTSTVHAPAKDPIKEAVAKAEERERKEQLKAQGIEPQKRMPNAAEIAKRKLAQKN